MPRWLSAASRKFRRPAAAPAEQPYEIACVCGRPHRGLREERWQEIECDRCGHSLFVLPRNVYPEPADEPVETPEARGSTPAARRKKSRRRRRALLDRVRSLPAGAGRAVRGGVERVRRRLTRLNLVIGAAVAVVAATVWWGWSVHVREQAALALKQAVERGEAALRDGDLRAAAVEFRQASAALATLGRNDSGAREVRQLDRECHAATHLATASIVDMLEEARRSLANDPSADWEERFRIAYGDRWVVFDTVVQQRAADGSGPRYSIEYPLTVGDFPVVLEGAFPAFDRLRWDAEVQPVIFAARIKGCRLTTDEPRRWVLAPDDRSAFLWSHYETYRLLGFQPDDLRSERGIQSLLADQSRQMGLPVQTAEAK